MIKNIYDKLQNAIVLERIKLQDLTMTIPRTNHMYVDLYDKLQNVVLLKNKSVTIYTTILHRLLARPTIK